MTQFLTKLKEFSVHEIKRNLQAEIDNLQQEVFICTVYQFCEEINKFLEIYPDAKNQPIKFTIGLNGDDLTMIAMGQNFLEEPEWLDNIDGIFSQPELEMIMKNFPDSEEVELNLNSKDINSFKEMLLGKDLLIALRHEQLEMDLKEKTNKSVSPKI